MGVKYGKLGPTPTSISTILSCVARVAACDHLLVVRMHTAVCMMSLYQSLVLQQLGVVHVASVVKLPQDGGWVSWPAWSGEN